MGNWIAETAGVQAKISPQTNLDLNLGYTHALEHIKLRHSLGVKNLTNSEMITPEFTQRNINEIPATSYGCWIMYTVQVDF